MCITMLDQLLLPRPGTPSPLLGGTAVSRKQRTGPGTLSIPPAQRRIGPKNAEVYGRNNQGPAVDRPMFVMNQAGKILFASPSGEMLLEDNATGVQRMLAAMVQCGSTDYPWNLMCLQARDRSRVFLLILETPSSTDVDPVSIATSSWHLTQRQRQVLDLVARGLTNLDAAKSLQVTESSVEYHLSKIFDKAGVDNRATLIARMRDLSSKPEPAAISDVRRLIAY